VVEGSTPLGVNRPINRGSKNAATELTVARASPLEDANLSRPLVPIPCAML
jgi:hypothetical protein